MKHLILISVLFFSIAAVVAQDECESLKKENERLENENGAWKAENAEYLDQLRRLSEVLERTRDSLGGIKYQTSSTRIEIETMKGIIRGYVHQIDSLQTRLKELEKE